MSLIAALRHFAEEYSDMMEFGWTGRRPTRPRRPDNGSLAPGIRERRRP